MVVCHSSSGEAVAAMNSKMLPSLRRALRVGFRMPSQRGQQCVRFYARSAATAEQDKSCWNCHHATDCCSFFCKSCDAIQPLHNGQHCDYFELFELPKNFNLEQRKMEQTYWNLQKRLHPDLYGSKSEFEKELSAMNAAVVNDAYNMLKTPNTRVKYLLALHGIDALSETSSTAVDPELLMQTMEIRERVEEAETVDQLDKIRSEVSAHIDQIIQKLGEVYDNKHDLEATKNFAVELQYMVKCAEEIDMREEKLEG